MFSKFRGITILLVTLILVTISASSVFAATTKVGSKTYTHPSFYKTKLHRLFHGVDVSYWQGSINWKKSKAAGIDFAIIRCGYTALSKFTLHQDSYFTSNIKKAAKAGVSIGVYYYASATTKSEAKKEANYVISLLKNNNVRPQLPVVMDYEFGQGRANNNYNYLAKKKGKSYARKVYTNNAKAFMNQIKAAGYETMFYSYRVLVDPKFSSNYRFNMSEINGNSQYRFWLAQYSSNTSYSGKMEIWQFSSTAKVSGMKGNIDRNFWYYPLAGVGKKDGTKSIRDTKIKLSGTKQKYDGSIKEPDVTVKHGSKKLSENKDYTVSYMDNIDKGTATVLVHGKGDYSDEAFTTFTIGDVSNDAKVKSSDAYDGKSSKDKSSEKDNDKEEKKEENVETPSKVKKVTAEQSADNSSLTISWNKADNATRYKIIYKVNDEKKWRGIISEDDKQTIQGFRKKDIVEFRVRAENVKGDTVKASKYTSSKYRYMRFSNSDTRINSRKKIKIEWVKQNDKKGKVEYQIFSDCISKKTTKRTSSDLSVLLKGGKNRSYTIWVKPILVRDGKKYYGSDHGSKNHVYLSSSSIKSTASRKKAFAVRYEKVEDEGTIKYDIAYSTKPSMLNAKHVIKPKDKVKAVIKKLKADKNYYVTVQPYKEINGLAFRGVLSGTVNVKTK